MIQNFAWFEGAVSAVSYAHREVEAGVHGASSDGCFAVLIPGI